MKIHSPHIERGQCDRCHEPVQSISFSFQALQQSLRQLSCIQQIYLSLVQIIHLRCRHIQPYPFQLPTYQLYQDDNWVVQCK